MPAEESTLRAEGCSTECYAATTPFRECTCMCGGHNHGRAHGEPDAARAIAPDGGRRVVPANIGLRPVRP